MSQQIALSASKTFNPHKPNCKKQAQGFNGYHYTKVEQNIQRFQNDLHTGHDCFAQQNKGDKIFHHHLSQNNAEKHTSKCSRNWN